MTEEKKHILSSLKIKALLAEYDMKPSALGSKIGVNRSTVSAWTNGTRRPDGKNARKLEEFFKLSKDYFNDEESSMNDDDKMIMNGTPYDIVSYKIAAGYFDIFKQLAKLLDDGKISEETFNKAIEKLDK